MWCAKCIDIYELIIRDTCKNTFYIEKYNKTLLENID